MNPIDELRDVHKLLWKERQEVSPATKSAIQITREWQRRVIKKSDQFEAEFPVAGLGEKIDLVDTGKMIAYELKVSPNNVHMEFYRDMFKVLAHNEASPMDKRLKELFFITPQPGAARLQRGLGKSAPD